MKKAKKYLDNLEDIPKGWHWYGHTRECIDISNEIAFLEGQLKVIRDSEMCNAGEREIQYRLKQLLDER